MLQLRDIGKTYGKVQANDAVNLTVESGQIHALLGENGAGKSTLMKILFGLVQPDQGTVSIKDQIVKIRSPQDAKARGIGMVQQHFALFDGMTALENIALGLETKLKTAELRTKIAEVSSAYGLSIDPDALVLSLSAGQKQRIEIVRALLGDPQILVLDEPTSVLTPQEAEKLFAALRTLRDEGRALIFISHKLGEVKSLCDSATILRGGKVVASCDPRETSTDDLAELMIGKRPMLNDKAIRDIQGPTVLQIANLRTKSGLDVENLRIRAGEILGVAGIAGNGQDRLFAILSGEEPARSIEGGSVTIGDEDIRHKSPNKRRALGARFVPEERLGHAAIPDFRLTENTLLTKHEDTSPDNTFWRRRSWIQKQAQGVIDHFDVRGGGVGARARSFSGGNLQKFVVGRELGDGIKLLLINQPTWGVDLWAAGRIRQEIMKMADQDTAVLLISQDLDELLELCDTMAVIAEGKLTKARPAAQWTIANLGRAMAGEELHEVRP